MIADGVQAINDEFLQWYVQNPNCKEVKVVIMNQGYNKSEDVPYQECYRIDIPFEEPKQEIDKSIGTNLEKIPFHELVKEYSEYYKNIPLVLVKGRKQETFEDIQLEEVTGSKQCQFSVIENKLEVLYRNQEQILKAIKLLKDESRNI